MMDAIDKKLISLLEKNARIPLKQLAANVFLTSPAVAARLQKLEESGIISEYRAIVDPTALGLTTMAFIEISMNPKQKPDFTEYISSCPNVAECYHVAGIFSMLLKVYFSSTSDLDKFVTKLQTFGKTQTQIVFSTVKEKTVLY